MQSYLSWPGKFARLTPSLQTRRHGPHKTYLPLHPPQPQPNLHNPPPNLPPPARPPRHQRTLPARSNAQSARHARGRNAQDPQDRRGREGGGAEESVRQGEEGGAGEEAGGHEARGAEEVFGAREGEGEIQGGEEEDYEGLVVGLRGRLGDVVEGMAGKGGVQLD